MTSTEVQTSDVYGDGALPPLAGRVKARLARGSLWIGGARAAINVMGFVTTVVLARLLMPADFGLVALGTTFVAILGAITDLQLSSALVQHPSPSKEHFASAFTVGVARGLVLSLLLVLVAPFLASLYHEPRLEGILYGLAVSIFLSGLGNPRSIMLTKNLIFWQQFMLQVSQKVVALVVSIGTAIVFRSYWALVYGAVAGQVAGVLISYTVLPYRPRFSLKHVRELWSFSIWLTLGNITNTLNWRFDQVLIGGSLGRTALGFYTVGDQLAVMPTREAIAPLTPTLFPGFVAVASDPVRLARAYQSAQALVTAIALPAGVGMALVARPFIEITMGEKWLPAAAVVEVLATVFALQTLGSLARPLAMAGAQTRLLFVRDLQGFCIRLPTIIAGMYFAGLKGIIMARALTGVVQILLNMGVVRRLSGLTIRSQLAVNWRSLVAVTVMVISVLRAQAWFGDPTLFEHTLLLLLTSVAVGGLAYVGTTAALWELARRPPGPEAELLNMLGAAKRRFGRRSTKSRETHAD